MNWSAEWRKLVLKSSLRKRGDPFTTSEFVEWYELQLEHNNYPGVLLDKVQKYLNERSTVLDIGAGTGAFTIPIAQKAGEVTAIEPSAEMSKQLRSKAEGLTNIHIIDKRWQDVNIGEIGRHDLVLAAHSLYGIVDIGAELKKMLSTAKTQLCIITRVGQVNFYADIWQRFKEEEYHPLPSFIYLYNVLYELGIPANVEVIRAPRDQVYSDIEQAAKHWMDRLDLLPEKEDELRVYLLNRLEEKDGVLYRKEEGISAIISIELPV